MEMKKKIMQDTKGLVDMDDWEGFRDFCKHKGNEYVG